MPATHDVARQGSAEPYVGFPAAVRVFATIEGLAPFGLISQMLFGLVVLATARPLWAWFDAAEVPDSEARQP